MDTILVKRVEQLRLELKAANTVLRGIQRGAVKMAFCSNSTCQEDRFRMESKCIDLKNENESLRLRIAAMGRRGDFIRLGIPIPRNRDSANSSSLDTTRYSAAPPNLGRSRFASQTLTAEGCQHRSTCNCNEVFIIRNIAFWCFFFWSCLL